MIPIKNGDLFVIAVGCVAALPFAVLLLGVSFGALGEEKPKEGIAITECQRNADKEFHAKQKVLRQEFVTCTNDAGEHILNRYRCLGLMKMQEEVLKELWTINLANCGPE